jgi:DNA-binding beta-propeller fold protein YncE
MAFAACDHNATVVTVDENTWRVEGSSHVGDDPDVLAYDANAHQLYVAAESGIVTVLDLRGRELTEVGSGHLADGAHVVAVDPSTHHTYYPVPDGSDGRPALLVREPS